MRLSWSLFVVTARRKDHLLPDDEEGLTVLRPTRFITGSFSSKGMEMG